MSRIGKLPISIPAGVTVAQDKDGVVTVKGPKGELSQKVDKSIIVKIENGQITFEVDEKSPVNIKQKQAFHGLYRALVHNMVVGVSEGYKKEMELVGVGYRVSNQGNLDSALWSILNELVVQDVTFLEEDFCDFLLQV